MILLWQLKLIPYSKEFGLKRGQRPVHFRTGRCPLVELGGIEPPSKQVTHKFSTCLSCYWFSC
jgi:hypothetical protein